MGKYVGEYKNGKRHGHGTYIWACGHKYVGEWKDGKRHGKGEYTSANGNRYVGEWKDGLANGEGEYTWSNGNKYIGAWVDGKRHGRGEYICADGGGYIGDWFHDVARNKPTSYYEPSFEYPMDVLIKRNQDTDKLFEICVSCGKRVSTEEAYYNSAWMLDEYVIDESDDGFYCRKCAMKKQMAKYGYNFFDPF